MTIERKFVDLRGLKVRDSGPGTIEGYRAVFQIDESGDLIIKGAFLDCIPAYNLCGFTTHSHDWSFSESIGFPVEAREDAYGLFVKSQFHSTSDAQDIRTKVKERMEAGKQVGFSFGYDVQAFEYIQPRDYESRLAQHVKPEHLTANIAKAKRFSQIRILKRVNIIEDSIVTRPMNTLAAAISIKDQRAGRLSAWETARLRSASLELRMRACNTLYGVTDQTPSQLRRESCRLRAKALRILYC